MISSSSFPGVGGAHPPQTQDTTSHNTLGFEGDTLYVGGSGPNNYTKIQDAIDNASDNDTVFIYDDSAPYIENVVVDKTLNLVGEQKTTTVIDGSGVGDVISISADHITLQGFTIQHGKNDWRYAGIKILCSNSVFISETIIRDNGGPGISISGPGSSQNIVFSNMIINNSYGIYAVTSSDTLISRNTIVNNTDGIYLVTSNGTTISKNMITNKWSGIQLEQTSGTTISQNHVAKNGNGIYFSNSSHNLIEENEIIGNRWYGIWFWGSSNNTITNNTLSQNQDLALYLCRSSSNSIIQNTFLNNDNGIYIEYSSYNLVSKNTFRNYNLNAYFVASTSVQCRNYWNRNYWDRPRLAPCLIFGKMKRDDLHTTRVNIDRHPLLRPIDTSVGIEDGLWSPQVPLNDGTTLYVGGSGPGNYSTIQDAVDAANSGDTIYVFNGTYYENIIISTSVFLRGEKRDTTIIDGSNSGDAVSVFADDVTVQGFTIQNSHFGIVIQNSSGCIVTGNNITDNLRGVSLWQCRCIRVLNNAFIENVYGIRLYVSSSVSVHYNYFHSYKSNAFFLGTSLVHGRNNWNRNYWDQSRVFPYPITGKLMGEICSFRWFDFDWHPLVRKPALDQFELQGEGIC
jgi:parallel beta-helix repeat protein